MIDTHCHIDDEQYTDSFDAVISRQKEAGVEAIVVPGVNIQSIETVMKVCSRYPGYLFPALGLHPEDVKDDWQTQLERLKEAVWEHKDRLVAIGEIGLDYHWDTTFQREQQLALREQLDWALELNLPVIIHARDAAEPTFAIMREYAQKGLKGVMHCYSGSREMALEYVKLGYKLGIGGVITFKNCKLADTLCPTDSQKEKVPLEALVLETDAPYMAPIPHRGEPNESRYMSFVVEKLATTYGVAQKDVISSTNRTAKMLFDLK